MTDSQNSVKRKQKVRLDGLDMRIIGKMMENSRMTYQELADTLGISTGTVHMRLKKLDKIGIFKGFRAHPDPHKIGLKVHALVGIQLQALGADVVEKLKPYTQITRIYQVGAPYNLIVEVYTRGIEELAQLVKQISEISGVFRAETLPILDTLVERELPIFVEDYKVPKLRGRRKSS
ncbi:MAG: Lrp/AsnC family transcriptional regulator [Bacteroidia bacterium]